MKQTKHVPDNDRDSMRQIELEMAKLSQFIIKLTQFYRGIEPQVDSELKRLRSLLNDGGDFEDLEACLEKLSILILENSGKRALEPVYKDNMDGEETTPSPHDLAEKSFEDEDLISELSSIVTAMISDPTKDSELVTIQAKLKEQVDQGSLLSYCKKVIGVISRNATLERRHGEKFVLSLQNSVVEMSENVSKSIESAGQTSKSSQVASSALVGHISEIENAVQSTDDLKVLKEKATQYLSKMTSTVGDQQQLERKEHQALIDLLNSMQSQLSHLESKTTEYKQRLIEQKQKSHFDPLTKIPNRTAYNQRMEIEFLRWQRSKLPLSMAIIDVDKFKGINDNYGHAAGDKTLKVIAQAISSTLRKSDFVARWGGEEFVVLFPDTPPEGSKLALEKIRVKIAKIPFKFKDKKVAITVSSGGSSFQDGENIETVFERADKNLYEAKQTGRNKCIYK